MSVIKKKNYSSKSPRSAIVIAKMLDCQGFNDDTSSMIDRYYRKRIGFSERQLKRFDEVQNEIGRLVKDWPVGDRLILGKFIGFQKHMAFDTGLRVGLSSRLKDYDLGLNEEE